MPEQSESAFSTQGNVRECSYTGDDETTPHPKQVLEDIWNAVSSTAPQPPLSDEELVG